MKASSTERLALLKSVALFADLSENECAFLAGHSSLKHFAPNELIFSEGDDCLGLFIIQSGAVKIFKMAPSGREQVLGVERGGNTIAELPVFDGGAYPASTVAVEESDLLFVKKEDFRSLCLEHPEVALKVLKVVGKRLRGLVGIIEELSRHGYKLSAGTLYPILHRLEKRGYLSASEHRDGRQFRRVYVATRKGRTALRQAKGKAQELFVELFEKG